jgi:hypothetical protein
LSVGRLADEADRVHVSINARRRAPARARQLTVHRVTDLSATRVDGLPVTPPARTLVDAWDRRTADAARCGCRTSPGRP